MKQDELVADDERTIEILSRELLRLEKREHELEAKLRAVECAECEKTLLDCECE